MPCFCSLIVIIYHSFSLPACPASKSPPTPPLCPELRASPWEVIYNAIRVTIMHLHTISLCPLCLGRLLWATFLFSLKHIVQPSSMNMQKHLAQTEAGRLPVSEISGIASSIDIFCLHLLCIVLCNDLKQKQ